MLKLRSSEIPAEELPEHIALLRGCGDDVMALLDSLGARLERETPRSCDLTYRFKLQLRGMVANCRLECASRN
jgi:hypothetical protein